MARVLTLRSKVMTTSRSSGGARSRALLLGRVGVLLAAVVAAEVGAISVSGASPLTAPWSVARAQERPPVSLPALDIEAIGSAVSAVDAVRADGVRAELPATQGTSVVAEASSLGSPDPRSPEAPSTTAPAPSPPPAPPQPTPSVSVGRHNNGRLVAGVELRESPVLRFKNARADHHHGTAEMVSLLERAAAEVARQFPGSRLTIGDVSRPRGGRFRPHRSHRTGRDVDIGFYVSDAAGAPLLLDRFVSFDRHGRASRAEGARFDDARNWALVAALVGQDEVPVQYMFVSRELRARLLRYGQEHHASADVLARAEAILDQPSRGGRHADHFHMRIFCALDDLPRCRDDAPFHPWVERPSRAELEEMRQALERPRQRARARHHARAHSRRARGRRG